jgi:molybdenum cofactor cytidylyltransferase
VRRVAGILLAAGEARRFGRHKLLAPLADGTPLAIASARKLFAVIPDSVIVLRENDSALAALCDREGWRTVICRDAAEGMGRSLASGVDAAADADAWIIALADMPYINEETVARVAQAMARGASIVAPFYAGQRGHPVGISANHRDQLMALRGDHGACIPIPMKAPSPVGL